MIIRDVGFGLLGMLHALEFRLGLISPFEFDLLVVSSGDFENPTSGLLVSIPSQPNRFTKSLQKEQVIEESRPVKTIAHPSWDEATTDP